MSIQSSIDENTKDIGKLYDHAKIANQEMGVIKEDIGVIQNDIKWIKQTVEKIDSKFWWIITAIIAGVVIPLIK